MKHYKFTMMSPGFQIHWEGREESLGQKPEVFLEVELRRAKEEYISETGEYPTHLLVNRQLYFAIIKHLYHITDLKIDKGGDVKERYVLGMQVMEGPEGDE